MQDPAMLIVEPHCDTVAFRASHHLGLFVIGCKELRLGGITVSKAVVV
jgi:hypothetical protein